MCYWDGSSSKYLTRQTIMTGLGTFAIEGSFQITGRGLVIYGDVIAGKVKKDNFLVFVNEEQELKLKIDDINFLDWVGEGISKAGLTFYYENDDNKTQLNTSRVAKQIAKITGD
jgi:hypothetical protein